jgi:hypothetical protein
MEANPLLEPLYRQRRRRRVSVFGAKDSCPFFSAFHSQGFLHIPLTVFLSIPLLNQLIPELLRTIPLKNFALRATRTPDWTVGGAGEWNAEKNQRSLSSF